MSLHDEIITALKKRGAVMLEDDSIANTFIEAIRDCPTDIPFFEQYGLVIVLFYDPAEQTVEKWQHCDGIAFRHFNKDGGKSVYSIGISTHAIERGKDYTCFIWLHEAAHVLRENVDVHDNRYHALLDVLIEAHNKTAGASLVNDYQRD